MKISIIYLLSSILFLVDINGQINNCELLITGNNSEYIVSTNGIIQEINNGYSYEYHEIYENKIYYLQNYDEGKILIYDIETSNLSEISINTNDIDYFLNFKIIDEFKIALLDNRNDKVYFIDHEGNLLNITGIPNASSNWQSLEADILNEELILAENGNLQLIGIDINTYESRIFKDLSSLEAELLGKIKIVDDYVYVSTRSEIYRVTEDTEPEELINLNGEYNISGLDIVGNYFFFQTNFGEQVYYADTINYEPVQITSSLDIMELADLSLFSKDCLEMSTSNETVNEIIELFPNPAKDQIILKSTFVDYYEVLIYTLNGIVLNKLSNPKYIDVSKMTKGFYIFEIRNNEKEVLSRKKIIIE